MTTGLLVGLATLAASEGEADAAVAYIRSSDGQPWGQTVNEEAMDLVFGVGAWDDLRYDTVDPMMLLSPTYTFIYMEGSDNNALELQAFLMANQAALEAWVTAGGDLFLNAAPNEGGDQMWGFGGVLLDSGNFSVDPGTPVNPAHPIFNGPFLPTPAMWTGSSYAHAAVSGPGLVDLIQDSEGDIQLAELPFGSGLVLFGGLTTSNFWNPAPESLNLRANMIAYLSGDDTDMDGLIDALDNCPEDPNPMQDDMDMDNIGDVCDVCPDDPLNDADMDMACDGTDNCLDLPNPMQADDDMDGQGNACDECPGDPDDDADNDTICGDMDNCPNDVNVNQADDDMDGIGNICDDCPDDPDNDPDEDGVCAIDDNCPDDPNPGQEDEDGDGVGDACDDPAGAESSGGGMDTGDMDTGSVETGVGDETGTDPDTSGGGGTTSGGGGTTNSGDDAGQDDSGDAGGCACTTTPSPGGSSWWLMAIAGLALRRRRNRAA